MNSHEEREWVEDFYSFLEQNLDQYKRPADYKERAKRVLSGKRKPARERQDGRN